MEEKRAVLGPVDVELITTLFAVLRERHGESISDEEVLATAIARHLAAREAVKAALDVGFTVGRMTVARDPLDADTIVVTVRSS